MTRIVLVPEHPPPPPREAPRKKPLDMIQRLMDNGLDVGQGLGSEQAWV